MENRTIKSALISVYNKDGLQEIVSLCNQLGITMYSTGGTQDFIENLGFSVVPVENITSYPSILDGRVKTLHPKIFGGILAKRNEDHLAQLSEFDIPTIDLAIVDLYPFEETVSMGATHEEIIEKIDIGGISLIRAAAKNYQDVVIISSMSQYPRMVDILKNGGETNIDYRKKLASEAFIISSHYDTAIYKYINGGSSSPNILKESQLVSSELRYGENPHQRGYYYGNLDEVFDKMCGKELSYNNLVDVDAAVNLMYEFRDDKPTFAILKHTNSCGIATRATCLSAWTSALASDPISAFGGILICNTSITYEAASEIDNIFYEVLIAPNFEPEAYRLLSAKAKRIILKIKTWPTQKWQFKSLLNGAIGQDVDLTVEDPLTYQIVTKIAPTATELEDLVFANRCVKHLKSNTIVLVKEKQLLAMGCGQTSRIDACRYAIEKAKNFGFDLEGSVMASDAFFPFPDCVELAAEAGIKAVIQPGGSIKDKLSVNFCDDHGLSMVLTGIRHFKH